MNTAKILLTLGLIVMIISCNKDENPDPNNGKKRYKDSMFTNVTSINDITYGSNVSYAGVSTTLKLDLYYPDGDTETNRPLLILLPGGSFGAATDKQAYLVPEAEALAKYGYVVACMNYRIYDGNDFPISNDALKQVILHGMQDAKAAIRFFREDASNSNAYKINPNKIFLGGHSAGAIVALHTAYLDEVSKADPGFQDIIQANGGLEGNSGHSGYSSSISGVINLAGGLLDKTYLTSNGKPLKNIYGDNDQVITIDDGFFNTDPTIASIPISGGNSLNTRATSVSVTSSTYVISGGDHLAPALSSCTGCLNAIAGFMYNLL